MGQNNNHKEYPSLQIRTIALIGHGGSGKTTFSEAALFASGVTNRQGRIEDGNTISDYHPDEIERKELYPLVESVRSRIATLSDQPIVPPTGVRASRAQA